MSKLNLPELAGGYADANLINTALSAIEEFSDTVVTRDGAAPNAMAADLDLNSNRIINLADGQEAGDAATIRQLERYSSGLVRQTIEVRTQPAFAAVLTFNDLTYTPGANNLAIYRDGVRLVRGVQYTETSPNSITFVPAWGSAAQILAITNEYVGTVDFDLPTVPWSNLSGVPAFASRWPTYAEVTAKPDFAPLAHAHLTEDISRTLIGDSLTDDVRGVFVQAAEPTATRVGDLWFW